MESKNKNFRNSPSHPSSTGKKTDVCLNSKPKETEFQKRRLNADFSQTKAEQTHCQQIYTVGNTKGDSSAQREGRPVKNPVRRKLESASDAGHVANGEDFHEFLVQQLMVERKKQT